MERLWQHFLAWLRGDTTNIVKQLDRTHCSLHAHQLHQNIEAQRANAVALAAARRSENHIAERDRARTIRNNIGALIGK